MDFIINYSSASGIPHKHTNYEIYICTGGEGVFWCEEYEKEITEGTILIVPPETAHRVTTETTVDRIYIAGEFNQFFNLNTVNILHDNEKGEGLFLAKMIYDSRHGNFEYLSALINAFVHFILCNMKMDNKIHASIKEIANKISNEFSNCELSLSELLTESGYSEDYIRSQFKYITGKTPTEFLSTIRITHACFLIDTYRGTVPLTKISEQCGYLDYVYFSKKFKEITGVSPRKYTETINTTNEK